MKHEQKKSRLFASELMAGALRQSFVKLKPSAMIRNPVMFTVEIGTLVMLLFCIYQLGTGDSKQGSLGYNLTIFLVLLLTVLFANFAEALAEARGKRRPKVCAERARKHRRGNCFRPGSAAAMISCWCHRLRWKKAICLSAKRGILCRWTGKF